MSLSTQPASLADDVFFVRRERNQWRHVFGGPGEIYMITHLPTGEKVAGFRLKRDAVRTAQNLYKQISPEDWQTAHVGVLCEALVRAWAKLKGDTR